MNKTDDIKYSSQSYKQLETIWVFYLTQYTSYKSRSLVGNYDIFLHSKYEKLQMSNRE